MKNNIHIITLLFAFLGFSSLHAQAPSTNNSATSVSEPDSLEIPPYNGKDHLVTLIARNYGDSIVLRWAPHEAGVWRLASGKGWTITRYGGSRINADSTTRVVLNNGNLIKPLTLQQMKERFDSTDLQAGAVAQMLYGNSWVTSNPNDPNQFSDYVFHQDQEQGQRQAIVYLLSDFRADLADAAALRFVDRDIEPGASYQYYLEANIDPAFVAVSPATVIPGRTPFKPDNNYIVPPINVEQVDSSTAIVYWARNSLTGYFIERSTLGGEWQSLSNLPVHATNPDEETRQVFGAEISRIMEGNVVFFDSLPINTPFRYRVRGYDAFADYCGYTTMDHYFKMVDIIAPESPIFTSVVTDSNTTCTLYWQKDTLEGDLKGYVLTFSHSTDGPWHNVSSLLSPSTYSYIDPDAGLRGPGYYRLFTADTNGNASFSLPIDNKIADVVAPNPPTHFQGYSNYLFDTISTPNGDSLGLSSQGQIYLEWDPVDAYDLLGYRVFYANSRNQVYTEATSTPITELFLFDTININTITPYVYYYVVAVDQRYNYSRHSDTIAIRIPDIIKPAASILLDLHQSTDSVAITWSKSVSADVRQYFIYRRPKGTQRWVHLHTIPAAQVADKDQIRFVDHPTSKTGEAFEYSIEVLDSTGLSSGRYGYVNVYVQAPRHADIKIKLDAKRGKNGNVNLSWKYDYRGEDPHWGVIYRSIEGGDVQAIASFKEGDNDYTDTTLPAKTRAEYYILLHLGHNCTSSPSNTASVK